MIFTKIYYLCPLVPFRSIKIELIYGTMLFTKIYLNFVSYEKNFNFTLSSYLSVRKSASRFYHYTEQGRKRYLDI